MPIFFAKRLFQALIAIFGVMTLIFFLQRLAGDPVLLLVPMDASQADIDRMRIALGFDRLAMLASGARRIEDVLWLGGFPY